MAQTPQKAVFFDRDGVVNVDDEYVYKIEDFVYVSGFLELFKSCKEKGYLLFVITNQSGIGRGYYGLEDFLALSDFMQKDLREKCGFAFDKIYFCAHAPSEDCPCRKPKAGMITQALGDFDIDLEHSYLIGDKLSDMECGKNGGIGTRILLDSRRRYLQHFAPPSDKGTKASQDSADSPDSPRKEPREPKESRESPAKNATYVVHSLEIVANIIR